MREHIVANHRQLDAIVTSAAFKKLGGLQEPGRHDEDAGKTSLVEAVKRFDLDQVREDLRKNPELRDFRTGQALHHGHR